MSSDRNRGTSSKGGGGSLPRLCREMKMTHILLGKAVHQQKQFDKIRSLLAIWPDIVMACNAERGVRYVVQMFGKRPKLERRDEPEIK